ncbi:MAG: OmpA family protein [Spirochaetes bacterium]|nr:OmpA family protein [Spirochaetota bacterium]
MRKYGTLIILFIILFPLTLPCATNEVEFKWNFRVNKNFTIDKFTAQTITKNGVVVRENEIRDFIIIVPQKKKKNMFPLLGNYYSYQRPVGSKVPFQLIESYKLDFSMDEQGHYEVDKKYVMPSIRNIPVFLKKKLIPGETWQEQGIEVMEFKPPVTIPVDVNYQFTGIDTQKFDKPTAKIVFNYMINHVVDHNYDDIPYKFLGASYSTLWYDTENQLPLYIENIYNIGFIYKDGTVIQYKGDLLGYYNLKRAIAEKEKVKKEMYNKLKNEDKDLKIKKSKEGLVIEFDDIYFKYNSAELTDDAQKKLVNIARILEKYQDIKVITKGHTDNIGSQSFNLELSENRAKNVLEYLIKKNAFKNDQGSYKGYGKEKPVADNSTKAGRSRNRRVEIFINPE